jgi:hypothetical protein
LAGLAFQSLAQKLDPDALPQDWEQTVGLSTLLSYAKALPPREPWDVQDLEQAGPMGKLLAEARAWRQD